MDRLSASGIAHALFIAALTFGASAAQPDAAAAGQYVRVSPDLEIHYEEAGSGPVLLFNPGWAGTTEFFDQQIEHFSDRYRVIVYDPRSQGRSSKTLHNNNYEQHGHDLRHFMEAMEIDEAILVAHSWGCLDSYAHFRAYGVERIKAFVCIDITPTYIARGEDGWGFYGNDDAMALKPELYGVAMDWRSMMRDFMPALVTQELSEKELDWMMEEVMKTPSYAALELEVSGMFADYSEEARMIDGKIPVLNVLSDAEGWTEAGEAWLAKNAPNSEVAVLGAHLMFWEFPDRFNEILDGFLSGIE